MRVVGLTGGVGMGKSTVAEILVARGESVIDTDVLAREVVKPGSEALEEIKHHFGTSVLDESGALARTALAREVFASDERRHLLERILHPRIRQRWMQTVEMWRKEGRKRAVVVIPLLFETGAESEMGQTVCVGCSTGVQMTRLRARGWSGEEAQQRIAAQWPITRKLDLADKVIWNESTVETCALQVTRIFA